MKRMKIILIKVLIIYLIVYILLGSFGTCFARGYDAACGEFVSQYARDFIATYCTPETKTEYVAIAEPNWTGGSIGNGTFQCCCTAGVKYMYELALSVNLYDLDFSPTCSDGIVNMASSPNWTEITSESDLQPGDVVINSGHTELYIGNSQRANFGNDPHSGVIRDGASLTSAGGSFTKAFRLKSSVDVNPTGTVKASKTSSIDYSKFFFNGVPDGKYSLAKRSFWETIIDALVQILDYIFGLMIYLVRAVFVGFTAIMENLLNWMVNVVSDTGVESKELNMSSTETSTSEYEEKVTVDSIIFNKLELFDINIFKTK